MEELPDVGGSICGILEGDDARTSVTDEGRFTWSSGDQVWLQTTSGSVAGTLSSGAGTANAQFSYGAYIGELTGKAVCPYNSGHDVEGNVLTAVLPSSYDLGSNLNNTNALLYGVNAGGTIRFNHLAGVMRFVFRNVPAGTDKFQLTLDKKINGTFVANLTDDCPIIETSDESLESEKTVTLSFDPLKSATDISLYVPLPVGTYTYLGLDLWAGDTSVWSYANTVTNKISRKTLKLMPAVNMGGTVGGELEDGVFDLSKAGPANCYIVSEAGSYMFIPTKGNVIEPVGNIDSVEVLWESFGTDVTPASGDLVRNVRYENSAVYFETPADFKEGNAVIAAKDAGGRILWSWHIWLTDQPEVQVYYNNAGTMMDRNLGATSASPGDVGALGLFYQWGRKDPFLGASSIDESVAAKSTLVWPSPVESDSNNGTIEFSIANPTTFITRNINNHDWYYSSWEDTDNYRRWAELKNIYDPCPRGWRVPDGGENGVWHIAVGFSSFDHSYDSANRGMDFSETLGSAQSIWFPNAGYLTYDGILNSVGSAGSCWSASHSSVMADAFKYWNSGKVSLWSDNQRATGRTVRCVQDTGVSPGANGNGFASYKEAASAIKELYNPDLWKSECNRFCNTDRWTDDWNQRTMLYDWVSGTIDSGWSQGLAEWKAHYRGITLANEILNRISNSTIDLDEYAAEAKFFRASFYMYLIASFGDVPFATENISLEEAYENGRVDRKLILQQIYKDYDAVTEILWRSDEPGGRVSVGAALAMKARAALLMSDWETCAEAAKACMDWNKYSLHPDFEELFHSKTSTSPEFIFTLPCFEYPGQISIKAFVPRNAGGTSVAQPSWELFFAFTCTDGKNVEDSPLYDPANPFANRDPRLAATTAEFDKEFLDYIYNPRPSAKKTLQVSTGTEVTNKDCKPGSRDCSYNGLVLKKFVDEEWVDDLYTDMPSRIIRYADVLLMYAEAKMEMNQIDQSVHDALNSVRARAYKCGIDETTKYPAITETNQSELRRIIRNERRCELAWENRRWFDLIRWRVCEECLTLPVYGLPDDKKSTANEATGYWPFPKDFRPKMRPSSTIDITSIEDYPDYYTKSVEKRGFVSRQYFYPIPFSEIYTNRNLVQNPGY